MLITLITDFGYRDSFVGIMKGVIARINAQAQVIDLTHGIPPQDVMAAALTLSHSVAYFPDGTVHVAVIDPGVGSTRRPLLIKSGENYFIGPDNGVLSLAVAGKKKQIVQLTNSKYHLQPTSATFHGRDVFASVAAHVSLGVPIETFGIPLSSLIELNVPEPIREKNRLEGEIIYIDRFGNLFTNIRAYDLSGSDQHKLDFALGPVRIQGLVSSYDAAGANEPCAVINSWGLLEIAQYGGNAQQKCHAKIGDKIVVTWNC